MLTNIKKKYVLLFFCTKPSLIDWIDLLHDARALKVVFARDRALLIIISASLFVCVQAIEEVSIKFYIVTNQWQQNGPLYGRLQSRPIL